MRYAFSSLSSQTWTSFWVVSMPVVRPLAREGHRDTTSARPTPMKSWASKLTRSITS